MNPPPWADWLLIVGFLVLSGVVALVVGHWWRMHMWPRANKRPDW